MADRDSSRVRLTMVGIVCLSLFASLVARLWYLQGIAPDEYQVRASGVHLRSIHEEGTRGRILDRNGKVLVDNRVTLVLGLDRQELKPIPAEQRAKMFDRLSETLTQFHIPTKSAVIEQRYNDQRWGPLEFVPVLSDLPSQEIELYVAEHASEFPGVEVRRRTVRTYPYGSLGAHLVGYVGQINAKELEAKTAEQGEVDPSRPRDEAKKPYQGGDEIGKGGVEATFEGDLRGIPGDRRVQVDARGDYLTTVQDAEAKPGDDIWLTIDLDVQAQAERILQDNLAALKGTTTKDGKVRNAPQGSIVITNPQSGEILAMASYPSYDPSKLVNGIDSDTWKALNDKSAGQPLFNWALQGAYAPGSTFKLFSASAGLESGFLQPGNDHYNDSGSYKVKDCKGDRCTFSNAGKKRNGSVDVTRSLTVSSDTFYYWIADGLWQGRQLFGETPLQDWAGKFGIGSRTGVALPGETKGKLPTPELIRKQHEENPEAFPRGSWFTGDNLNTSIGQGDVLVSPLQLTNAYATFANGGTRMTPLIVSRVTRPIDTGQNPADPNNYKLVRSGEPVPVGKVTYTADHYARIANGLLGVVMDGGGTAHSEWTKRPAAWPMAGKTGTAEVNGKADTSIFVGYGPVAPGTVPTYAISVVVPEAGFGADVAAPMAFGMMQPISQNAVPPLVPPAPTPTPGAGG